MLTPPSRSLSSRRGSQLHMDFSSLANIKEPTAPTNTLILTNIPENIFNDNLLDMLRELVESIAPVEAWIPLRSFTRVVATFKTSDEAVDVRMAVDGQCLLGQNIKIFYGNAQPRHTLLEVPALEKNWLISPPGSPPVGWTQIREDPPIKHEELYAALATLEETSSTGPKIVVHLSEGRSSNYNIANTRTRI